MAVGTGCGRAVCSLTPEGRQYLNDSRCHQLADVNEHDSDDDETENTRGYVSEDLHRQGLRSNLKPFKEGFVRCYLCVAPKLCNTIPVF